MGGIARDRLLAGVAVGATVAYFLDPERGKRRQKRLLDRAVHGGHIAEGFVETAARDTRNRARGVVASARWRMRPDEAEDVVLIERVRSALGRATSHPGAIDVSASDGLVTLCGTVLSREHEAVIRAVSDVRGATSIEDLLDIQETAGETPALQGAGRRRENRFELAHENWSPSARLIASAGGAALVSYGLRRADTLGTLCAVGGGALLLRAMTNKRLGRVAGVSGGRSAVHIQKTTNVSAPIDEVYAWFTEWERWPEWMSHVREVRPSGERGALGERLHWVVDGPAGVPVSWNAEITEVDPRKRVAWRSVEGAAIRQAGAMHFEANADGGTRVHIHLTYNPPAGVIGHTVAKLFGRDPRHQMNADLARLKTTIETGVPPHDSARA
jgi:uncharacterized membrane protein